MSEDIRRIEIAKLELRDGDSLVIRTEMHLSLDQIAYIREQWKRYVPEGTEIIVLGSGLTLEVLRRTEP